MLAFVLPNFNFDFTKEKPIELNIELMPAKKPEPVAAPQPVLPIEPPKPEVIKPEPIKKIIEPKLKPITKPIEAPSPITQTEPIAQPTETKATPNIMAAEPTADSTPTAVVAPPVAEIAKPIEASPAEVDNALGEYGSLLGHAIAKHKSYPKIAQMRGWQGDVLLDLKLDGNGNVLSAKIKQGSGFEVLDKQALEMVRKASPFPAPPQALRSRSFNITVPVSFKLE